MHNYLIYCDDYQEGYWFQSLDSRFDNAELEVIPSSRAKIHTCGLDDVLKYDRPDIILQDNRKTIFVLERTIEVPSGHNVGQRYGRLLAAAENRIPVVYFGPYAAYKHGGNTAGPRYMNLRLFYSLNKVANEYNTAITTIRWPVDSSYEVLKVPEKDKRVKEYLSLLLGYYETHGYRGLTEYIKNSPFQKEQITEQTTFALKEIENPEQYDYPPNSVEILSLTGFKRKFGIGNFNCPPAIKKVVLYHIGMNYIRSDPYSGMSALYRHLYLDNQTILILYFENIESSLWYNQRESSKTYRMYKDMADAILFADKLIPKSLL